MSGLVMIIAALLIFVIEKIAEWRWRRQHRVMTRVLRERMRAATSAIQRNNSILRELGRSA